MRPKLWIGSWSNLLYFYFEYDFHARRGYMQEGGTFVEDRVLTPDFVNGFEAAVSTRGETHAPRQRVSEPDEIHTDVYAVLNSTAVLFQELQRATQLNPDELLTLATIATANLQRWHRTTGCKGAVLASIRLVPASQSAVARATGTPRQTMRRRLEKLIAMGTVGSSERGLVINFENLTVLALLRSLPGTVATPGALLADVNVA